LNLSGGLLSKGGNVFQVATRIIKWVSLPALLVASMFSRYAASYELHVDLLICMGAVIVAQRAVRLEDYFWAAGFVAIAVIFSPLLLVLKVFLLIGFTCTVAVGTLLAAFRTRPLTA